MEMECIVGEPVREAERLGVPVPTLSTIYSLLKGLQLKTKEAKGLWKTTFRRRQSLQVMVHNRHTALEGAVCYDGESDLA